MKRREAIEKVALLMGVAVSSPSLAAMLTRKNTLEEHNAALIDFTPKVASLLEDLVETIIPTTKTPGAKAAGVDKFITTMVAECYTERERKYFLNGINEVDSKSQNQYKKTFVELTQPEKNEIFKAFEKEAFEKMAKKKALLKEEKKEKAEKLVETSNKEKIIAINDHMDLPHPYFMLKDLTVLGYFTSEIGATQALEYLPIPGRYNGCVPLIKGQKAWALQ